MILIQALLLCLASQASAGVRSIDPIKFISQTECEARLTSKTNSKQIIFVDRDLGPQARTTSRIRVAGIEAQAQIEKVLGSTKSVLKYFSIPPLVHIVIQSEFAQPRFEFGEGGGKIYVPEWLVDEALEKREASETLLFHEFGHQIFVENIALQESGPFVDAWKTAWAKRNQAFIRYYRNLEGLERKRAVAEKQLSRALRAGLRSATKFKQDFVKLDAQYFEEHRLITSLMGDYFELNRLTIPYQELFADLVAVLTRNDPSAVAEALRVYGSAPLVGISRQNFINLKYRDFQNDETEATLKAPAEEHLVLAPTRKFIGKTYLNSAISVAQRQLLLKVVYEAIVEELNSRFVKPARIKKYSSSEMNQRLIKQISVRF